MSNFNGRCVGKTQHQLRVEDMMKRFGQTIRSSPGLPADKDLDAQVALIREEFQELMDACDAKDLVEIADSCADLMVVVTGLLSRCGIHDLHLIELVDFNNLKKVSKGCLDEETGKFIKSEDHEPPDIKGLFEAQARVACLARGASETGA